MAQRAADLTYCGEEVRKFDADRFLISLFAPPARRAELWAVYAFNLEVAKTREVVSEPTLGLIRLQWWREAVDALYAGEVRQHAVLSELAPAIQAHDLSKSLFDRLIDVREQDLSDEPPANLVCLVNYAEVTGASPIQLSAEILGARSPAVVEAAKRVGTAYALTGLLRAVPFHARDRRLFLPADLLADEGISQQALFDLKPPPTLPNVVRTVAAEARRHLGAARALRREVPPAARAAMLPAVLADLYLGVIERAGFDVFAPRVQMPNPFRQIRLAWAAARGRW